MKKVLIVDDAATVRMYLRSILEAQGYAVAEAANGYEGLEKAMTGVFDLFLVDVNMPKMDGYTLLRKLREQEALQQVPAIMISTESKEHDADLAYEAGADLFLVKPVAPEALALNVKLLADS